MRVGLTSAIALACRSSQAGQKRTAGGASLPRSKRPRASDPEAEINPKVPAEDAPSPHVPFYLCKTTPLPDSFRVGKDLQRTERTAAHGHVLEAADALLVKLGTGSPSETRLTVKQVDTALNDYCRKHFGRGIKQGVTRGVLIDVYGITVTPQVNYCRTCQQHAMRRTCTPECDLKSRTRCHMVVNVRIH